MKAVWRLELLARGSEVIFDVFIENLFKFIQVKIELLIYPLSEVFGDVGRKVRYSFL